jgi:hypothetical protein
MWIVLPTKDCKCATCEKLREFVDENGTPNLVHGVNTLDHLKDLLLNPAVPNKTAT